MTRNRVRDLELEIEDRKLWQGMIRSQRGSFCPEQQSDESYECGETSITSGTEVESGGNVEIVGTTRSIGTDFGQSECCALSLWSSEFVFRS